MSQQKFVDRERELQFLMDRYHSPVPECLILYGRRRVGKTALLARFLQTTRGFYFLASEEGTARNISDFSRYAGEYLGDPDFERSIYPDWQAAVNYPHLAEGACSRDPEIARVQLNPCEG